MTEASPGVIVFTAAGIVRPGAWQRVVADNDVSDPQFDDHFERVQEIERGEYRAVAAAFVCIAVVLIGTRYRGWTW